MPAPLHKNPTCHPTRKYKAKDLCTPCYGKSRDQLNPNRLHAKRNYNRKYSRQRWSVSEAAFAELLRAGCPICLSAFNEEKREPVFDHDHVTGEFRGLLCQACNRGIGLLKDSAGNAKRASTYLGGGSRPVRPEA
jgi:hypothetical protein